MSHRWFPRVTLLLVALMSVAVPAQAQTNASPLVPRGDVFAGVAFWDEEDTGLCGFHVGGAWRPVRHVGIVGEMAIYGDATTLMGGVRVQNAGRHTLFGQLLIGNAPLDDIALQPGVGVDVRLSRRSAVRAGFDVKISGDDGSTYVGTRLSVGLVILLGQQ
jgi:hypothetical protein